MEKKLESVLQSGFDEQDWLATNMKEKANKETNHAKKQKYLKAAFAALGGRMAIKQLATRLGIKLEE